MRRVAAISALSFLLPACGGAGDSAADAGGGETGEPLAVGDHQGPAPDVSTEHDVESGAKPGAGDVLEDMYKESIVRADLQGREAAP